MDGSVANRRPSLPRSGIAERIWSAARSEFSKRGYHGARVQGIARGAACNVALIYRHWASKRALYLDILRAVWVGSANELSRLVDGEPGGPTTIVAAYLDAMMDDPMGAQILIREYLDGAPFLAQLAETDPALVEPVRRAADALVGNRGVAGDRLDPILAVVTVGGLAALVASSRDAARPFVGEPLPPEAWRRQVFDLLLNGLTPQRAAGGAAPEETREGATGRLDASGHLLRL
jgi:AcrR family transcriptional regulator